MTLSGGGDHNNDDGQDYFFKVEAMQKTGSFKFRGALNAVKYHIETTLQKKNKSKEEKSKCDSCSSHLIIPVVTHSSGNHAQALALASKLASSEHTTNTTNYNDTNNRNKNTQETRTIVVNVTATIVMPRNCPHIKKQAVVDFGAEIVLVENTNEARKKEAERIVSTTPGAIFVHPSENPQVMAGQGTVCLEFVEQVRTLLWKSNKSKNKNTVSGVGGGGGELDAVIIPVGGGGLAAGNCMSLRGLLGEKVKIILAEPAQLDDAKRSFTAGQLLGHHDHPDHPLESVADGLKTTLGPNTWPIVRDFVDDIITVSEQDILRATKLVWERLKVVIEPSAGVGVAVAHSAEFHHKYSTRHGIQNVGIILCGGNVDILQISSLMQEMGL